ncbi:MAG: SufS family cysteine desulfurase [Bacteroidales bacterium]|nr:SufS family cysteine desulfurase [Bacteroidales bacterium]
MFDVEKIRKEFPILRQKVNGKDLIYLDNGATVQKPKQVIEIIRKVYSEYNSNIHRGVHYLSNKSTELYEGARETIRKFINAQAKEEIIFTKGTTDAINLVAFSFGEKFINEDDEILIAETEHHSNIVPWQMMCERKKAHIKVIPADENGELIFSEYKKLLNKKTKLVAVAHVANSTGIINPINEIITEAHKIGAKVLIDGAQAIQHKKIDIQQLDCDFYVFSGHKMYAETGIGVLYGKKELLKEMPPYQGGGDMIKTVSFKKTEYADLPLKFEAGTSNYVGAISLGEAVNFIKSIGIAKIEKYETGLLKYAEEKLSSVSGLTIYGKSENKTSAISFLLEGIHFYDVGMILDKLGIAVRTGAHCAEPTMKHFDITGTVRASFAVYNTKEEIDKLISALQKVKMMFK